MVEMYTCANLWKLYELPCLGAGGCRSIVLASFTLSHLFVAIKLQNKMLCCKVVPIFASPQPLFPAWPGTRPPPPPPPNISWDLKTATLSQTKKICFSDWKRRCLYFKMFSLLYNLLFIFAGFKTTWFREAERYKFGLNFSHLATPSQTKRPN